MMDREKLYIHIFKIEMSGVVSFQHKQVAATAVVRAAAGERGDTGCVIAAPHIPFGIQRKETMQLVSFSNIIFVYILC